jgi:hypothetical protein
MRFWRLTDANDSVQWRAKLHHINSNEIRYFQDWAALIPLVLAMLRASNQQIILEENDAAGASHLT